MIKTEKYKFPKTFWSANFMELFERWGWYGIYSVLAVYLTEEMGFSQVQKGDMMGLVTFLLYVLPLFTGALADRIGYKKILIVAYLILLSGYYLLSKFDTYYSIFYTLVYIAIGASLFKPIISATISKTTNKENVSVGFGIFYMIVNIGAFFAPLVSSILRQNSWDLVFFTSSIVIGLNIIILNLFFKEPNNFQNKHDSIWYVFKGVLKNVSIALSDIKFVLFLLIVAGFWCSYFQLFYTLPVFISQWVDTRGLYNLFESISPILANVLGTKEGTVNQEVIINIDAGSIILFQVLISSLLSKVKPLNSILLGFLFAALGMGFAYYTNSLWVIMPLLFVFAIGEMSCSPKITEYIGSIAPKDKIALYMGCSFLPIAFGSYMGGFISGRVYHSFSDKKEFIMQELELNSSELNISELSQLLQNKLNMDFYQLNNYLWDKYNPELLAFPILSIGLFSFIALIAYNKVFFNKN